MAEVARQVEPTPDRAGKLLGGGLLGFLVTVLVAALALRLLVVGDLSRLPTAVELVEDARAYDGSARELMASGWLPDEAFYQAPLYPYFLAAVYSLFGFSAEAVRAIQAVLGALSAALIGWLGRKMAGPAGGWASGFAAAGYAAFLFYTPLLLKPTLLLFFESVLLLAAWCFATSGRYAALVTAAVALGLAVLVRGNMLLVVPFFVGWVMLGKWNVAAERSWRHRLRAGLVAASAIFVPILPVTALNYRASGELILSSSQSGSNFYIGNRRGATGSYASLVPGRHSPAFEQEDARRVAAEILARESPTASTMDPTELSPRTVSRTFWRQSLREIGAAPGSWLLVTLRKAALFWNWYELPDAEGFDVYRRFSPWLRFNPLTFAVVAPLGLLGLWRLYRERRDSLLLVMTLAVFASVVPFFVFGRYRLPVVPMLIAALSPGFLTVREALTSGDRRGRMRLLAGIAAAALVVWLPLTSAEARRAQRAVTLYNLGNAESRLTAKSMDQAPRQALARTAAGAAYLTESLRQDPSFAPARVELGVLALRRATILARGGAFEEALAGYEEAAAHLAAARALPGSDRFRALLDDADTTLTPSLASGSALALANLGARARREGDVAKAVGFLEQSVERDPMLVEARLELAAALLSRARSRDATEALARSGDLKRAEELLRDAASAPDGAAEPIRGEIERLLADVEAVHGRPASEERQR